MYYNWASVQKERPSFSKHSHNQEYSLYESTSLNLMPCPKGTSNKSIADIPSMESFAQTDLYKNCLPKYQCTAEFLRVNYPLFINYRCCPDLFSNGMERNINRSQQLIIDICVRLLKSICINNTRNSRESPPLDNHRFHCDEALVTALVNILRFSATSYSALFICIIYLIRFKNGQGRDGELNQPNELGILNDPIILFAIALILSLKFITDKHISNNSWECICGLVDKIPLKLFNSAESYFLQTIHYDLYVEPQLINHLADMIIGK